MKKLFLVSSFKDVSSVFESFEKILAGKTVTFIPTASVVEKVVFYVDAGRKALRKLGLTVDELEISTASADEIRTKLTDNDIIYVTGGNTFYLLQELKRTGADKMIIEQVNSGKLYIGESAGAMITSANVEYAQTMDSIKKAPQLTDYNSLGLADFYTIPHYTNPPFNKAAQKIMELYSPNLNIIPISNSDAILVDNGKIHTVRT